MIEQIAPDVGKPLLFHARKIERKKGALGLGRRNSTQLTLS
jgi:hypothetical protein